MAQYIDKDVLVSEINKRIIDAPINNIGHQRIWAYNDVKDIIDTLEVKEVDLNKPFDDIFDDISVKMSFDCNDNLDTITVKTEYKKKGE